MIQMWKFILKNSFYQEQIMNKNDTKIIEEIKEVEILY